MRVLDKIAFNRLVAIIANFILSVIKIFAPKAVEDIEVPEVTPRKKKDLSNIQKEKEK